MRLVTDPQELAFVETCYARAVEIARKATCSRSRCGSVIAKDGEIIGEGFNSPAGGLESRRRCACAKSDLDSKVTDKTCCVHAEQRAIMDALAKNPDKLPGATLYFVRLDGEGVPKRSGEPYCTICSKMSLDSGIAEFVLWKPEGYAAYPTEEYDALSYAYRS